MKRTLSARELRLRKVFAKNIRARMDGSGTTATLLAKKASVSRSYLFHLLNAESGASIDVLARLAHALKTTPSDLLRSA